MLNADAWITTGGLDKGVDQLIGNEVKQKLANEEAIPKAVLGISHWGELKDKKALLNVTYSAVHSLLIV